jgi:NDMA-dependent alcohol dehydrogenase
VKTHASILRSAPGKFESADLDLEGPRSGELTVRLVASGLCHSDDHMATGDIPAGTYPLCGGHEGSGVVTEVGPETAGFEVDDHVVFTFVPSCGRCRWCAAGMQNLCDLGANMMVGSRFEDTSSFRMTLDGQPVGQMCGISTFSELTTVSVNSAVKVPKEVPLVPLCLLGCGVGTGWGSAVNAAQVQAGQTVVVMGIGGIGTSAVQGAAHAGATNVIAVDPVAFKRESAMEFGATHTAPTMEEATELASHFTNGQGPDSVIVTVGVTTADHVGHAVAAVRKAGTVVVTGAGKAELSQVPINLLELTMAQKKIVGALFGAASPFTSIPWLTQMYTSGRLKLDEMITKRYSLDEVAKGYEDMHAGTIVRGIVEFDR